MHTKDKKRPCRISIHALREEGDNGSSQKADSGKGISIHALREEGDGAHGARSGGSTYFYPRPP